MQGKIQEGEEIKYTGRDTGRVCRERRTGEMQEGGAGRYT